MVKHLKDENFESEIKKGLVLVDFYADWCGPCKALAPILEELEDISVLKINTEEHTDLAVSFGVMSIPTLILFKDGEQVGKKVGFMNKEELEQERKNALNNIFDLGDDLNGNNLAYRDLELALITGRDLDGYDITGDTPKERNAEYDKNKEIKKGDNDERYY